MFCGNCGNLLPEGAKFCGKCGAAVPGSAEIDNPAAGEPNEPAQPIAAPQPPPGKHAGTVFANAWKTVKNFFSKSTVKTVGEAAKSDGGEWSVLGGTSVLAFGFATAVTAKKTLGLSGAGEIFGIRFFRYNFGLSLLFGILIAAAAFFAMSFCIFGAMKLILKADAGLKKIFNLVAAATLPITPVCILNMILGSLWEPFIALFSITGLAATAVLLYAGMQKLAVLDISPFPAYIAVWAVTATVVMLVTYLLLILYAGITAFGGYGNSYGIFGRYFGFR